MPRGKNYNAAEEHFLEKEKALKKEIAYLKESAESSSKLIASLNCKIGILEEDTKTLNDWVNRLLAYTELDKDDIKKICEWDLAKGAMFSAVCFKQTIYSPQKLTAAELQNSMHNLVLR